MTRPEAVEVGAVCVSVRLQIQTSARIVGRQITSVVAPIARSRHIILATAWALVCRPNNKEQRKKHPFRSQL